MKKVILFAVLGLMFTNYSMNAQCGSSKKHHVKSASYTKHQDIVDIAISSDVHTTLVAAVKAADLVNTLKGDGPFTVFAPTNLAFERLPSGTVENLLKPNNKSKLSEVLTYHVIPSQISAKQLVAAIQAAGGEFSMKTVQGTTLRATMKGGSVVLVDNSGNISKITATNLKGSNGFVHVIDAVVLP